MCRTPKVEQQEAPAAAPTPMTTASSVSSLAIDNAKTSQQKGRSSLSLRRQRRQTRVDGDTPNGDASAAGLASTSRSGLGTA